jgi:DNA-binding NarL/FixJ family response regulator
VRVAIADDAVLLREGIARLLGDAGFEVVATYGDAEGLLDGLDATPVDVCVLDIKMPPTFTDEGLRAAITIRSRWPQTGVLVLSQYVELGLAVPLLADGAEGVGYLLKDRIAEIETLLDAVRRIAHGGCVVDPAIVEGLVTQAGTAGPLADLSDRERQVLGLVAEGLSNQVIAERLAVSDETVDTECEQIFLKLGLHDEGEAHRRVAAVLTYLRATAVG